MKWRVKMSIDFNQAWLSQLDLLALIQRSLRRGGFPLAYSQGFNPHMLISWGPAHAVGVASLGEYFDLEFSRPPREDWLRLWQKQLPEGLDLLEARPVPPNSPALMAVINLASYCLEFPFFFNNSVDTYIKNFWTAQTWPIERVSPKGKKEIDAKAGLAAIKQEENKLLAEVWLNKGASLRPAEIATIFAPESSLSAVTRTGLFIEENGKRKEP
ncbi:MAG: TIGR03936 family radical SAM-associated protein [Clostridiales bacterium]|nr:TIGR03936 family radical SAM-associated protein [Clostridiales bacterium]